MSSMRTYRGGVSIASELVLGNLPHHSLQLTNHWTVPAWIILEARLASDAVAYDAAENAENLWVTDLVRLPPRPSFEEFPRAVELRNDITMTSERGGDCGVSLRCAVDTDGDALARRLRELEVVLTAQIDLTD